jgi:hypothetical protein
VKGSRKRKVWEEPLVRAKRLRREKQAAEVELEQQQQQQGGNKLTEEEQRLAWWRDWRRNHTVEMRGTLVVFPPEPELAQQLAAALKLAGGDACVRVYQAGKGKADAQQAWNNTEEVTHWSEAHPITFKTLKGLLLWVGPDGGVVCGSLQSLLQHVERTNEERFTSGKGSAIFMLRKVDAMSTVGDQEQLYNIVQGMMGNPAALKKAA